MSKQHSSSHIILRVLAIGLAIMVIPAILLISEARSDEVRRTEGAAYSFAAPAQPAHFAVMQELEERFGIRVTLIGVTAAGGMVDFRFKVLDQEKARVLTQEHDLMPVLNVQNTDTRLAMPGGMHSMTLQNGKVYYILFGNPKGEVKPGTPISVAFGDMQLEAIQAQ
jgi:hypothetical protein